MPLASLWRADQDIAATRITSLAIDELRALMISMTCDVAIARIGQSLEWVDARQAKRLWIEEVEHHAACPRGFLLDDYPLGYAYVGSRWEMEDGTAIVLLEMHH